MSESEKGDQGSNRQLITAIQWCFKVFHHFFSAMPRASWVVVVLSIASRVSQMLALLLPIKVVLLLGATRIPRYFPEFLQEIDRATLIVGLSCLALVFYMLHMLIEKFIDLYVKKCARFLCGRHKKHKPFDAQQSLAEKSFELFMKSLAGYAFLILAFVAVFLLYPALFALMFVYLVLSAILFIGLYHYSHRIRERLKDKRERSKLFGVVPALGFFLAFAFILVDFLLPINPPGLISALIGLILSRQAIVSANQSTLNLIKQIEKKGKIEAIFFHSAWGMSPVTGERSFWQLLHPDERQRWVKKVLKQQAGFPAEHVQVEWLQTGIRGLAVFRVVATGADGKSGNFLVKLHGSRLAKKAARDLQLFKAAKPWAILPRFIGSAHVSSFQCHIHSWPDDSACSRPDVKTFKDVRKKLNEFLFGHELPPWFVDQYRRTQVLIWQRLDKRMFEHLAFIASQDPHREALESIKDHFDDMRSVLSRMPLQLMFTGITADGVRYCDKVGIQLIAWDGWLMEPVGFRWGEDMESLSSVRASFVNERPGLLQVPAAALELSARLSSFEGFYRQNRLLDALDELVAVPACIRRLGLDRNTVSDSSKNIG